jgi:hypothetical protein
LARNSSCDGPLPVDRKAKELDMEGYEDIPMPSIIWVLEAEKQNVPPARILPCYDLKDGDYKPHRSKSAHYSVK